MGRCVIWSPDARRFKSSPDNQNSEQIQSRPWSVMEYAWARPKLALVCGHVGAAGNKPTEITRSTRNRLRMSRDTSCSKLSGFTLDFRKEISKDHFVEHVQFSARLTSAVPRYFAILGYAQINRVRSMAPLLSNRDATKLNGTRPCSAHCSSAVSMSRLGSSGTAVASSDC
jgi:hypothetical protein